MLDTEREGGPSSGDLDSGLSELSLAGWQLVSSPHFITPRAHAHPRSHAGTCTASFSIAAPAHLPSAHYSPRRRRRR